MQCKKNFMPFIYIVQVYLISCGQSVESLFAPIFPCGAVRAVNRIHQTISDGCGFKTSIVDVFNC